MARLTFKEINAVQQLGEILYDLCSASGFQKAAQHADVLDLWPEGSKVRALSSFLRSVLEQRRDRFCILMQEIIVIARPGYSWNPTPLSRETMEDINASVLELGFKIPELCDEDFLNSLTSNSVPDLELPLPIVQIDTPTFTARFLEISDLPSNQARGYAFEKFLQEFFSAHDLNPRSPFSLRGEQIDGSFDLDHQIYLVEARWRSTLVNQGDLAKLDSRVAGHSSIGRGLFIAAGGFSEDGIFAHQRLRPSAMIGMDGQDLYLTLEHRLPLTEVLRLKVRRLIEEGRFHTPVADFWWEIPPLQ